MGTGGGGFIKDNDDNKKIQGGTDSTIIGNTGDQLHVSDRANGSGVFGSISVGVTAVEAKVGGSPLANRKMLILYNAGSQSVFYGTANTVTTANGLELFKNQTVYLPWGPARTAWLIAPSGTQDIRVMEVS